MTICVRESAYYYNHGCLLSTQMLRHWEMADHCESCGTTEGLLVQHPNRDLHMTICNREYIHYHRTGDLAPEPTDVAVDQ